MKPTVFANVTNDMTIAREEIFGPVLCILGYDDLDQAVEIAQRHRVRPGGLCLGRGPRHGPRGGAPDPRRARSPINHAFDLNAPFGGYKRSGNGREWGEFGFDEYLEIKGTLGYAPEAAAQ